jgi:c-di-AMP phosphodiesterase-like protein
MNPEFPYQLVAFLDKEPTIDEAVYYGENGWYAQIALKRRFKANGVTENDMLERLATYCSNKATFSIKTNTLTQPERMPVKVIDVQASHELMTFHSDLISFMGKTILSRYPERDGENYLPHITAEYNNKMVIEAEQFTNRKYRIERVCLLKDITDENAIAHTYFNLRIDQES